MNWLQKIIKPPATPRTGSAVMRKSPNLPTQPLRPRVPLSQDLPNATIIYGIGASLLFVASFSLLIARHWFTGLIVFVIGVFLMGFALHLYKHQD